MLNFYQLEQLVQDYMAQAKAPAVALAIVKDQEVIYARGFGVTSVEDGGLPVTPQTVFRIGSTSKPIAATVVMRLVDEQKLELDTPIDEILPDLQFSEAGAIQQVTLRKLLSHTAGLPTAANYIGPRELKGFGAALYEQIPAYRLVAPVGKLWSYSNPGIDLAGYIAEVASGKPYAQLAQEIIFEPLGMARTTLNPLIAATYPMAQSHSLDAEGNLKVDHMIADNVAHYPAGFVFSTVLDMAKFATMHMNGGRYGDQYILSAEALAEMHRTTAPHRTVNGDGYGLALFIREYKGLRRVGHGGRIDSYASKFEMVPDKGAAIIMQCNRSAEWTVFEEKITRYILDNLFNLPAKRTPIKTITPDKSRWQKYTGLYAGVLGGVAKIEAAADHLTLEWEGKQYPLKAHDETLYIAEPEDQIDVFSVGFVMEDDDSVEYITISPPATINMVFRRVHYDPEFRPSAAKWKAYPGAYVNDRDTVRVILEDEQLKFTMGENTVIGQPIDDTRFLTPLGLVTFEVEAEDKPLMIVATSGFFRRVAAPEA